ncbi:hypothetical protein [Paracoccus alkenifer]|uniref:Uncharacterized protein n=1 Tax=Paracoccus alkenifer TaxID=65735 RepID=A0A1H6MNI1_9RHOB|nr:hypothetical protein [Paracoccus alkenifer]SEI03392.1 hypothetical protein SAMN04488075_2327 [Paracoccus alkenifer]
MSAPYDTAFAHAVRQAATGLRTVSKVDPETEAAPLALILHSDRALDADGLELLAQLVAGKLRKVRQPAGESILAHAVRRAGAAWRAGKGADPATTGGPLADVLRAEVERIRHGAPSQVGPGERVLLADLVTGELRRGTARPPIGAGHPQVVAVVQYYHVRKHKAARRQPDIAKTVEYLKSRLGRPNARKPKHTSAFNPAEYRARAERWAGYVGIVTMIAAKFGITSRTVENYLSMMAGREAAIRQAHEEWKERECRRKRKRKIACRHKRKVVREREAAIQRAEAATDI